MIELLRTRRSVRKYSKREIEPEKIEVLKEALLRSPSSRNDTPWEFIFVSEKGLLTRLSRCKPNGADFLQGAAFAVVVCGDEKKSDVWIENCSITAILLQVVAHSLGLGSCWIQVRNRDHNAHVTAEKYIRDLLVIPAHLRVASIISIGYPAEGQAVQERSLDYSKIKYETYAQAGK